MTTSADPGSVMAGDRVSPAPRSGVSPAADPAMVPARSRLHVVLAVFDEFAMDVYGRSIHRSARDGGTGVTSCTATGGSSSSRP